MNNDLIKADLSKSIDVEKGVIEFVFISKHLTNKNSLNTNEIDSLYKLLICKDLSREVDKEKESIKIIHSSAIHTFLEQDVISDKEKKDKLFKIIEETFHYQADEKLSRLFSKNEKLQNLFNELFLKDQFFFAGSQYYAGNTGNCLGMSADFVIKFYQKLQVTLINNKQIDKDSIISTIHDIGKRFIVSSGEFGHLHESYGVLSGINSLTMLGKDNIFGKRILNTSDVVIDSEESKNTIKQFINEKLENGVYMVGLRKPDRTSLDHQSVILKQDDLVLIYDPNFGAAKIDKILDLWIKYKSHYKITELQQTVLLAGPWPEPDELSSVYQGEGKWLLKKIPEDKITETHVLNAYTKWHRPSDEFYLPKKFDNKEFMLKLLAKNAYLLTLFKKNEITDQMIEAAKKDTTHDYLHYLPDPLLSNELCWKVFNSTGYRIDSIPENWQTTEMYELALKQEGMNLKKISAKKRTQPLCEMAVKNNPTAFQFVAEKWQTTDMYERALEKDGGDITHVPKDKYTEELCLIALRSKPYAIAFIPEKWLTDEIIINTLEKFEREYYLRHLLFDERMLLALRNAPIALSKKLCENVIWANEKARDYIPEKYLKEYNL